MLYFAWVSQGTAWDSSLAREDEQIFSVSIEHNEGNFPILTIVVVNPKIGLLAAGRNLWAWLTWEEGSILEPIFFGRLIGIPANITEETVSLQFIAMPYDYTDQVTALAASMMVFPYYDPVWIKAGAFDPNTVLEGYSALWHIDRVTLAVTASDLIEGEDGLLVVEESEHFYDGVSVSYGPTPIPSIDVIGTVAWNQVANGAVDITQELIAAFQAAGSPVDSPLISSMTGPGLLSSWPKSLQSIGGGWTTGENVTIEEATWLPVISMGIHYIGQTPQPLTAPWTAPTIPAFGPYWSPPVSPALMALRPWVPYSAALELSIYGVTFDVNYDANRSRSEIVTFTLNADIQPLVTLSGVPITPEVLSLASSSISLPIDSNGGVPIGDVRRPSYFKTDRGQQSFQNLILLARAKLLASARAIDITFVTTWEKALGLSCRWSVQLFDYRLPGGSAIGKVKTIKLNYSETDISATITIACTCGNGNSVIATAGVPCYVEDDSNGNSYIDPGYQAYTDSTIAINDILTYESFDDFELDDDQVDFFNMTPQSILNGPVRLPTIIDPVKINNVTRIIMASSISKQYIKTIPNLANWGNGTVTFRSDSVLQPGTYLVTITNYPDIEALTHRPDADYTVRSPDGTSASGKSGSGNTLFVDVGSIGSSLASLVVDMTIGTYLPRSGDSWQIIVSDLVPATEASPTGGGSASGIATTGLTSGKFYFEFSGDGVVNPIPANASIGLALAGVDLAAQAAHQYIAGGPGTGIYNGNTSSGYVFDGWSTDHTVWGAIAFDLDLGLMWVAADARDPRWNDGTTIGIGTQNPWDESLMEVRGGIPFDAALIGQELFPYFFFPGGASGAIRFNFGTQSFVGSMPATYNSVESAAPYTANQGITISGGVTAQKVAVAAGLGLPNPDPVGALQETPTIVTLDLVPVTGGAFQTTFAPVVSTLQVPKTIDLEAPSL